MIDRLDAADQVGALRAGAGRAEIKLTENVLSAEGFGSVADPLQVRVLLVADTARCAALVEVDLTSIPAATCGRIAAAVADRVGSTPADVLVVASHTFSAPHVPDLAPDNGLVDALVAAADAAAEQADANQRPAGILSATATCAIGVHRDVLTDHGWWLGAGDGPTDPFVPVVRLHDATGATIATLINAAVQPSVMADVGIGGGGRVVTADLAGAASAAIERALGGVAFFLVGAGGDQAPVLTARSEAVGADGAVAIADIGIAGRHLVDLIGHRLAVAVLRSLRGELPRPAGSVEVLRRTVVLPAQVATRRELLGPTNHHDYRPGGTRAAPLVVLRLGDIVVAGVQVELSAITGADIRRRSPFALTLVATMVDGGAKYLPDASAYDRFSYAARSAHYARGGAELLADHLVDLLVDARSDATKRSGQLDRFAGLLVAGEPADEIPGQPGHLG